MELEIRAKAIYQWNKAIKLLLTCFKKKTMLKFKIIFEIESLRLNVFKFSEKFW